MELELFLEAQKRRGLTYEALAGQLGLERPEVWSILHGKRSASLKKLLAIAKALGIPPQKAAEAYRGLAVEKIDHQIAATLKTTRK